RKAVMRDSRIANATSGDTVRQYLIAGSSPCWSTKRLARRVGSRRRRSRWPPRKGALALERETDVGAHERREAHPFAPEERQHEQTEPGERADGTHRLDRARAADEVDVAAPVGRPDLLQQPRGVTIDDVVGCAGGSVRAEHPGQQKIIAAPR